MQHMTEAHSFFIPDREYLTDLPGFIAYLGEKISVYNMCLWCNENTKMFYSPESVQQHMIKKGHCKILYDGFGDDEFGEFYDFQEEQEDLTRVR
jgi:pre-60S factor REI1